VLAKGEQDTPPVPYYSNRSFTVAFKMPSDVAGGRVDAKLVLTYTANGRVASVNNYDIVVATRDWAESGAKAAGEIQVFDPSGEAGTLLDGYKTAPVSSLQGLSSSEPLVVGKLADVLKDSAAGDALKAYVQQGGRVLLLHPGADLKTLFPDFIKSYHSTVGEIVAMETPESPVFDGIEPLDTAWFEMGHGQIPYACSGTYEVNRDQPGVDTLAGQCDFHSDIKPGTFFKIAGAPIVEIHVSSGVVLASEMMYSARNADPIADRLLGNALAYLSQPH
jgi:hypothetical protein